MLLADISGNTDVALGLVITVGTLLAGWLIARTTGSTNITNAVKALTDKAEVAKAVSATDRETVKLLAGRVQHLEVNAKIRAAVDLEQEKAAERARRDALHDSGAAGSTAHGERPRR